MSENLIDEVWWKEIEKKQSEQLEASKKINEESTPQQETPIETDQWWYKDEDAWKFLSYIFDLTSNPTNKLWTFLTYVRLLPYYIFSFIIQLMWIILIPKSFVMLFWKIYLPILFWILIVSLFLFSWVQVALPSIDNALFWTQFFPLLWWVTWWLFFILFSITYTWVLKHYKAQYSETNLFSSVKWRYLFLLVTCLFLFLPLWNFYLWWWWNIFSKLTIVLSNTFWYLIYFTYTFLLINLILMIYKKIIYLIFSILDKETWKIWWHLLTIWIYLWIILLVNNFLEITLTRIW